MYTQEQVQAYMRSRITAHMKERRWRTETPINGVYCEELAEDAANQFDAYESPNAALPEQFLAWAIEIARGMFDYVKVSYADGSSREGFLVDITDSVGTLRERDDTATTFSVNDVVLDVLTPTAGQSMLANYPFAKDDVIIFCDGQEHLQGRFARKDEREGDILVFAGGALRGVSYAHIVRLRKPTCDFHVPPAYLGAAERVSASSIQLLPAEGAHAGTTHTFTAWNADYQLYGRSDASTAVPEQVCVLSIWEAASNLLCAWANESRPIRGYYKVDYRVGYQNGQVFTNVYLLSDEDAGRADLAGDMRSTCAMYSGRQPPAGISQEDEAEWRRLYVTPEHIAYFGMFLDRYEIGGHPEGV